MFRHYRVILRQLVFCPMTNKCTIISQIITLLHVSTLSCHPQTACILPYDQQMHNYFTNYHTTTCFDTIVSSSDSLYFALWPTNAQLFHKLSHYYMFRHYRVILSLYFALGPTNAQLFHKLSHYYMFRHYRVILRQLVFCPMTNKCTIISQIITLLHVSTLSCHPQTACILPYYQQMHNYFKNYHTTTCFDTIVSSSDSLYFALWPTNAQLFHKLSHCYMFRHHFVILRQPAINTLPSYTSIPNATVGNTIYN